MVRSSEEHLSISDYILKKCTPAKLPDEYLHVTFSSTEFKENKEVHSQLKCSNLMFPFGRTRVVEVPLKNASVLAEKGAQSKRIVEMTLDFKDDYCFEFAPGDTIGVLPFNKTAEVEFVIESLKLQDKADYKCKVLIKPDTIKKLSKFPAHIPSEETTPRIIIRDCINLHSVPKKQFLRCLAECCLEEQEKQFLNSLSSKEGTKLYNDIILERSRNFLDVLRMCRSCCPPLAMLLEHLPRLLPRPYSIANSPLTSSDNKIKIIFSLRSENPGLTTEMLDRIATQFIEDPQNPQKVLLYFREPNKFRYTADNLSENTIMISIGCGVAPFLGFLEHKDALIRSEQHKQQPGIMWLFTGSHCHSTAIYRDKLLDYQRRNVLSKLFESYSRDADCKYKHVQDLLHENASSFVELLEKPKTILYVCADGAQISKSIESCIRECIMKVLHLDESEAVAFLKKYRLNGKYREDIWI